VASTTERRECADDKHRLVEPRGRPLLEPAGEPPQRVPLATRPVVQSNETGQLKSLAQVERGGIARLDLRSDDVEGQTGTPFSKCVTAMAKLASGTTSSPTVACKTLSKEHVAGQNGTPFSRCVAAGAKLPNTR
jgi:hypothetical protein